MIENSRTSGPFEGLGYFRFLTLLSFHIFIREKIDVVVLETGVGGEYDSTNIVSQPIASGITRLGIDHVQTLGSSIEEIAWHKGGIFKSGCPAWSVSQQPAAMQVLMNRALERDTVLKNASADNVILPHLTPAQRQNASLAVALIEASSEKLGLAQTNLQEMILCGIKKTHWPGRMHVIRSTAATWYVDGAHTEDSLDASSYWFASQCQDA